MNTLCNTSRAEAGTHRLTRKSAAVVLVLSGALLTGCQRSDERAWSTGNADEVVTFTEPVTNNTYHPHLGYYHAPYRAWFPVPYNSFMPGRGYFHGGQMTPTPHESTLNASVPSPARIPSATRAASSGHVSRGGFGRSGFVGS